MTMLAIGVGYDMFVGCVTNMMAADVLRFRGPSLLEDTDPDSWVNRKNVQDHELPNFRSQGYRIKNYPAPQEAMNWWESDMRNTDGGEPKPRKNKDKGSEDSLKRPSKEVIRCILENGSDTTIIEASKNGHIDIVKILVEEHVDINTKDDVGYTSLSYAALKGHTEVVDLLIEYGADVNSKNNWGGTALVQAVFFGHVDIAKILIDNGANTNVTINGDSLVVYAAENGYDDLVEHLVNNNATYKDNKVPNGGGEKKTSRFKKWRSKLRIGKKKH